MSDKPYIPSIHITCYAYGDIHSAVLTSWIDLAAKLTETKRKAELRIIREDALISRSRCRATQFYLNSPCDVWIQIDHDIQFNIDDVLRMADLAHSHQAAVCIPYSCRSFPPRPALRPLPDAKPLAEDPTLTPILFFASGCVAIPRAAIEKTIGLLEEPTAPEPYRIQWVQDEMAGKFPTLWMPFVAECAKGKEYLSEDYAASARLSLCDIPQYSMEPSTKLQHWGDMNYKL